VGAVFVFGGLVLQSRGLIPNVDFSTGGSGRTLTSDRLRGSDGVELPESSAPDWWWTRVVIENNSGAPDSSDLTDGRQYSRVLIPTDVLFGRDSANISNDSMDALRDIAATVTSSEVEVIVVCHSSRDGTAASRKPLSEERANQVAAALETLLLRPANSIEHIGMGDSEPLPGIDQTTESGLALNRRCEIYIGIGG